MASARDRRGSGASGAPTLEACLAEARDGRPAPVYLLDGDAFLAARGGRELAEALVPEASRSLNLVELDGASAPSEVAAEVATVGLFGGRKVVLVHDPAFLTAKEDLADAFAGAARAWSEGRQREAARKLLALAAKAGVPARALQPGPEGRVSAEAKAALGEGIGRSLDGPLERFVDEAVRWARERELAAPKGEDGGALEAALAVGFPPGHVLVLAAGKVDGRLPLVKKLAAAGRRVTLGIAREGTWNDERLVLGPVLADLLAGTGKRVDAAAEARLAALVGDDARTLASEVAKLAAYAGDRKVITAEDVDALVSRVAEDPFFALGNAVEARDLAGALAVLDRSLADGAHPILLTGVLASTVRRLVVERERARKASGGRRLGSVREWERVVLPRIAEEELKGRKPYGFWMKYQASERFEREELLDALASLAEADAAMKRGQDGRPLLERVLWNLAGTRERREIAP